MFKYDVLIEEGDICNYEEQIRILRHYVKNAEKAVLYAPRRYGKTSILVNVLGKHFTASNKNALFCYVNLQEVKDIHSLAVRFSHAIEEIVKRSFSKKNLFSKTVELVKALRPKIEIDPSTGSPSITLTLANDKDMGLNDIFQTLKNISDDYPLLLVLDEFQDVAFISEAEAVIRGFLQTLPKSPVIISGSKRHILKDIFLDENKPFYNWGKSVELQPIPFEKWKPFLLERFAAKKIMLEDDVIKYVLESMYYVPNYICKLCSDIYGSFENSFVTTSDVSGTIHRTYLNSQSRYAEKVAFLTNKQIKLLAVLAAKKRVKEITSREMISASGISTRGLLTISRMLLDKGYLERDKGGFRVADPLFAYYLLREF